MNLLFVCTGNTCRSPMAEAIANATGVIASSAGLAAAPGAPANPLAIEVCALNGLDLRDHEAEMLHAGRIAWADVVLTMTAQQATYLQRLFPASADIIRPLDLEKDIVDPFGGTIEIYQACFRDLENGIHSFLNDH